MSELEQGLAAKLGQPSCSLSNVCSEESWTHTLSISLSLLLTQYHRLSMEELDYEGVTSRHICSRQKIKAFGKCSVQLSKM